MQQRPGGRHGQQAVTLGEGGGELGGDSHHPVAADHDRHALGELAEWLGRAVDRVHGPRSYRPSEAFKLEPHPIL